MSVALQVLLLVVAIVVAVAGLGVALALRLARRQSQAVKSGTVGAKASRTRREARAAPAPTPGLSPAPAPAASSTVASMSRPPAEPLTPEQAHQAKLEALQAMLALGDAKAEALARGGKAQFADTQPTEDYPTTQFSDRDNPASQISLLALDKVKSKGRTPR